MSDLTFIAHYYRFVKWFKKHHSELFAKYQLNILFPTEHNKITAAMEYVEADDREGLPAAIDQYYNEVTD